MKNIFVSSVFLAVMSALFSPAYAVDITTATAELTEMGTNLVEIGGLMLSGISVGVVFKWVIAYLL